LTAQVRASIVQTHLEGVERDLYPGVAAALQHLPPDAIAAIKSASRVGWVDIETNLRLNEGIYQAVGIEGGRTFFRTLYNDFFGRPLFATFMQGIKALGGASPGSYIKHAPRGWDMLWRGLGKVKVGPRSDHSIELHFSDQPERLFDPQLPWFEYLAAVFEVAFDMCECEGSSEVTLKRPGLRTAQIRFDWS
jgi:hypothetical protein